MTRDMACNERWNKLFFLTISMWELVAQQGGDIERCIEIFTAGMRGKARVLRALSLRLYAFPSMPTVEGRSATDECICPTYRSIRRSRDDLDAQLCIFNAMSFPETFCLEHVSRL